MASSKPRVEQSDSRTPDFKKPPKADQQKARAERDRRKACHGDWTPCKHSFDNAHPVAEDVDFYDGLTDSIPSDIPATVWESDSASKGA